MQTVKVQLVKRNLPQIGHEVYCRLESQYFHTMFSNENCMFKLCWSTVIHWNSCPAVIQDTDVCFSFCYYWLCTENTQLTWRAFVIARTSSDSSWWSGDMDYGLHVDTESILRSRWHRAPNSLSFIIFRPWPMSKSFIKGKQLHYHDSLIWSNLYSSSRIQIINKYSTSKTVFLLPHKLAVQQISLNSMHNFLRYPTKTSKYRVFQIQDLECDLDCARK